MKVVYAYHSQFIHYPYTIHTLSMLYLYTIYPLKNVKVLFDGNEGASLGFSI